MMKKNRVEQFFSLLKSSINGSEKDFTTGSIRKAIFLLAIPMVLEMIMESLFAVVDVFFVSKVSVDAVATVGLTESVLMLVYSIAVGLSMATTALVARRVGEKQPEKASVAASQGIIIGLFVAATIGISGVFFAEDILRLMGGSEDLIAHGKGYTQVMLGGNVTIILLFLLNAIFRGAGDASLAMRSLWLANGLNLVLDPLLIFGAGPISGFGVEGAAIATTIGRGIGVSYQLYHLLNGKAIVKLTVKTIRVQIETMKQLIKISLGGIGQYLIGSASWIFLVRIIAEFGSEAVAGYTIAFRIIIFTILPSWGVANAAATLVGQNLGAGFPDRAEKSAWKCAQYNMVFLAIISVVFFIFSHEILLIFTSVPEVIQIGETGLRVICFGYVFFAYGMVLSQSFNGAGDTKTPTLINLVCYWMLEIPLAYILGITFELGPEGVFMSIAISMSILAVISIVVFRKGSWKKVSI